CEGLPDHERPIGNCSYAHPLEKVDPSPPQLRSGVSNRQFRRLAHPCEGQLEGPHSFYPWNSFQNNENAPFWKGKARHADTVVCLARAEGRCGQPSSTPTALPRSRCPLN